MKQCMYCNACFQAPNWQCPICHQGPDLREGFPSFAYDLIEKSNVFSPDGHNELVKLEEQCFWFRGRNKILKFAFNHYFSLAYSFFEVGCGTGYVLSAISSLKQDFCLAGGDLFFTGLKLAKERVPQAEFIQIDAGLIPYKEEFDVVGAFDVLEHIEDDQAVLGEIFKAVKPGGGVMITVPQHQWLWSKFDEMGCHKRRYSRSELKKKVEIAGFKILRLTSFVSFLLPLMILSRLKLKGNKGKAIEKESILEGFILSKALNDILEKIGDLERIILRLGFSFSAGGSLLCVGRKNADK